MVLTKSDLIDKRGLSFFLRFLFGHLLSALFAAKLTLADRLLWAWLCAV